MVRFLLQIAKIVATPTEKTGSWVHTFSPQETEKMACRGELLAVVAIDNPLEEVEVAAVGKEIISRLHEEYYGELSETPFERLEKTVGVVFAEAAKELTIELAAVSLVKNVLNVSLVGGGKLVVLRQGKMATILEAEKSAEPLSSVATSSVATASGYVQEADLFLLGTKEFFRLVSPGVLQAALASGTPSEVAEALMPVVHGQQNGKIAAAVIFKVQQMTEEERKPEEEVISKTNGIISKAKEKIAESFFFFQKYWLRKIARPQKTVMTVALVLFLILLISLVFGIRQKKLIGPGQDLPLLLTQAQEKLEEAKSLESLNSDKSREVFLEAQALSQQLESSGFSSDKFLAFKKELAEAAGGMSKERSVAGREFFDLGMLKANALGDEMAFVVGQLIVLDKNQTSVYSVDVKEKKSAILAGGEDLKGAKLMAVTAGKVDILTEEGVKEKDLKNKNLDLRIKKDESWGAILGMSVFGNSLYLLDNQNGIWKYPATETGFGAKQAWLKAKTDLNSAISLVIDGSIWVLKSNAEVLKFTQGVRADFRMTVLSKPITQVVAFYTDENSESLYLLDNDNSRIVVLKKTGEYLASYLCAEAKAASRLAVSEADKKIWLLAGSKIYEIGI